VFAGPLTVRGNATVIDHGQGVYTGYLHQSEILVSVGEMVEPGQIIGKVGGTGRVTGPHLHWEVWVGGVQVEPMDWLEQEFPR
jgi:murein DD-endopeptidase MepM/ murein hydrolase activator NlpD